MVKLNSSRFILVVEYRLLSLISCYILIKFITRCFTLEYGSSCVNEHVVFVIKTQETHRLRENMYK